MDYSRDQHLDPEAEDQRLITGYSEDKTKRDAYLTENTDWNGDISSRRIRASLLAHKAMDRTCTNDSKRAQEMLLAAAEGLTRAKLPTAELRSDAYMTMDYKRDSSNLMEFFQHAGRRALEDRDYQGALVWLVESLAVLENIKFLMQNKRPKYAWESMPFFGPTTPLLFLRAAITYCTMASVFRDLGNTAASASYLNLARVVLVKFPAAFHRSPEFESIVRAVAHETSKPLANRHPEPTLASGLKVVDKDMHIYGSWKKIKLRSSKGITPRMESAVFAYHGYLYVCGGQKSLGGPRYSDFWRLDFQKRGKWESLPMFVAAIDQELFGSQFIVSGHRAYLFTGLQTLRYFDLETQVWGLLMTTLDWDSGFSSWPSPRGLKAFAMQCINDRIYIFGGEGGTADCIMGCDLFLELDLGTRRWRRLSGAYPGMKATLSSPGPRMSPASWVDRSRNKIFVMNGHVLDMRNYEGDHRRNYPYDDLWSWDIVREVWTKEKSHGNFPGPRSEMAAVYNSTLDVVVVFGGYTTAVPNLNHNILIHFSYFADTFICDMNETSLSKDTPASNAIPAISMKWKQVLTRGFPTYRAGASLIEDSKTGKTYLFSGFFEREFLPEGISMNDSVKCFADIWELRLDLAGGNFEGVDIEDESRTAKAGPWQRCFACGSVGSWKKCAGSCGGRAFFCDIDCLKDGWTEHRVRHQCQKI